MKKTHLLLGILVVAIWGLNTAVGKIAIMQMPAMIFLSIRFALTTLVFLPFSKLKKGELKQLFYLALTLNLFHYGFTFCSMKFLDASSLGVLLQTEVPIAMLLGVLLFKEKISKSAMMGIFMSFLGVLVILGIPHISLLGFTFGMLGSFFWAVGNIQMKSLNKINSFTFITYTSLFSIPFLLSGSYFFENINMQTFNSPNWIEILAVLFFQVIVCALAMMSWQYLLTKNDTGKLIPLLLLQPAFALIGGYIFFNEKLYINLLIGGIIISIGLYLVLKSKNQ